MGPPSKSKNSNDWIFTLALQSIKEKEERIKDKSTSNNNESKTKVNRNRDLFKLPETVGRTDDDRRDKKEKRKRKDNETLLDSGTSEQVPAIDKSPVPSSLVRLEEQNGKRKCGKEGNMVEFKKKKKNKHVNDGTVEPVKAMALLEDPEYYEKRARATESRLAPPEEPIPDGSESETRTLTDEALSLFVKSKKTKAKGKKREDFKQKRNEKEETEVKKSTGQGISSKENHTQGSWDVPTKDGDERMPSPITLNEAKENEVDELSSVRNDKRKPSRRPSRISSVSSSATVDIGAWIFKHTKGLGGKDISSGEDSGFHSGRSAGSNKSVHKDNHSDSEDEVFESLSTTIECSSATDSESVGITKDSAIDCSVFRQASQLPNNTQMGNDELVPYPLSGRILIGNDNATNSQPIQEKVEGAEQPFDRNFSSTCPEDYNRMLPSSEESQCVICSRSFQSRGCHYAKVGISIAGLKRRFCDYFNINTAEVTQKSVEEFLRKEKYPFCPECFNIVHDLYRRAEQLELAKSVYDKVRTEIYDKVASGLERASGRKQSTTTVSYLEIKKKVAEQKGWI